ncbi:hypothetical protein RclHR1_06390005 [Rhizophagus clarus]|uniref:Uncharacterized protein n=1 Tax=Rhizophagus clarus TaxID=94130 RepID=A0A2Z6S485_9GLOM|nr:hypothetical protein RclHR1_06390005 [Rhizophagus clarus]
MSDDENICEENINRLKDENKNTSIANIMNKLREDLSLKFNEVKTAFDNLCIVFDELRTVKTASDKPCMVEAAVDKLYTDVTVYNVTNQNESTNAKNFFIRVIYQSKELLIYKLREDYNILKIEPKRLQESYKESEDKVKELKEKLEEDYSEVKKIEVPSGQD